MSSSRRAYWVIDENTNRKVSRHFGKDAALSAAKSLSNKLAGHNVAVITEDTEKLVRRFWNYGQGANPHVYDSAGKLVGKFKRKAAKIAARVVGGTVGKPKSNPVRIPRGKALAFRTKASAQKWAREHGGISRFRIRKAAR